MATSNKKVIAVVSHALVQKASQKRWRLLAKKYAYEVHLLVPKEWHSRWLKESVVYIPEAEHDGNFHVHPLPTTNKSRWSKYFFVSIDAQLRNIKPDIIYIVHEEGIWVHLQMYLYRRLWAPCAKIIFFSMNAQGVPMKRFHHRWLWRRTIKNTEAALVHYPGCVESLREGGYDKPIYLQTQIGVDDSLFSKNHELRKNVRDRIGFKDKFVIGYAGRLVEDKGVDDLIQSLPIPGVDWALLLVGNGPMYDQIVLKARNEGWLDRLHITGFVPIEKVPEYMNAMDCFVLASKTMPHWIDTFPLVTVQAQSCQVPVVSSDSGSLPWQLGDTALFFPEGDIEKLNEQVEKFAHNSKLRKLYAEAGMVRSRRYFCVGGMTKNFDIIVKQVLKGEFLFHEDSEPYIQHKAY